MKRIDLSEKALTIDGIKKYFRINPPIGDMGERYQFVEMFAESDEFYNDCVAKVDKRFLKRVQYNLLINLSSAIEIHIRELIRINGKNWNKRHYPDLLAEKTTLETLINCSMKFLLHEN